MHMLLLPNARRDVDNDDDDVDDDVATKETERGTESIGIGAKALTGDNNDDENSSNTTAGSNIMTLGPDDRRILFILLLFKPRKNRMVMYTTDEVGR